MTEWISGGKTLGGADVREAGEDVFWAALLIVLGVAFVVALLSLALGLLFGAAMRNKAKQRQREQWWRNPR